MTPAPLPFAGPAAPVRREWIDGNGHMNLAYYVLVFDWGTDALCDALGLDARHRQRTRTGVFAAETHILYRAELLLGDTAQVRSQVAGADGKRLHLAHEMLRGAEVVATQEVMLLHVDLATRRVTPFPPEIATRLSAMAAAHAALPRPPWLGRRIAMPPQPPC